MSVTSPEALGTRVPPRPVSPGQIAAGLTLIVLFVGSVVALVRVDISVPRMVESWANAERFFHRVGAIRFPEPGELLHLTALTIGIVTCGTLLAAALSVPLAVLAAANTTPGRGWMSAARFVGVLTRAVPDVVLAMVFVLLFSLGALPGILAIGVHSIGMISKMFADAIEQVDEGPRRAIRSAGGSRGQEFFAGILPQVLPSWVATVLHRNDINLRGSVVLGYVGVAGLGLEMSHAFKALSYGRGLGFAVVIFVLCVVMEVVSSVVRSAMLGPDRRSTGAVDRLVRRVRGERNRPATPSQRFATPTTALRRPWTGGRVRGAVGGWAAVVFVVGCVWVCDITWSDFATFWAKVPAIAGQFVPPSFGNYSNSTMVDAMVETVEIALAATFLTFVLSIVVGSLAARNVAPSRAVRAAARLLLVVVRGVPEVILAIVLIVITGLGTQAGTLALAVGGVGLLGKLLADSLEEVQHGPELAVRAAGATRLQVYAGATLPQGVRALVGHSFYVLDTNVRAATLLGIVGGGGIGYYLLNAGQGSNYQAVTAIVAMILVAVLVVEGLAMWMRRVFR